MAVNFDAILKIGTKVVGAEQIGKLTTGLNQASTAASGLLKSAGPLGGALGALAPLATITGLTAMVGKTMETGVALQRLSKITGDSVADLAKLKKAVEMRGGSFEEMSASLIKLSKNMAAAAGDNGYAEAAKNQAKRAAESVKEGEKEQTRIIKEQADDRQMMLRNETNEAIKEINRRYRLIERELSDNQSDEEEEISRRNDKAFDQRTKQIDRGFEQERKAIEKRYDLQEKAIDADESLNKQAQDLLRTELEDAKQKEIEILRDRQDEKMRIERESFQDSQTEVKRQIRDRFESIKASIEQDKSYEEQAVRDASESRKKIIEEAAADQVRILQEASKESIAALTLDPTGAKDALDELGLSSSQAAKRFAELGVNIKDSNGKLLTAGQAILQEGGLSDAVKGLASQGERVEAVMGLMGKGAINMVVPLQEGGKAISDMTTSWNDQIAQQAVDLELSIRGLKGQVSLAALEITKELLPSLNALSFGLLQLIRQFKELPDWIKESLKGAMLLGIAWTTLAGPVKFLLSGIQLIMGLGLGATLAGWAGAIVPVATGLAGLVAGFVTAPVLIGAALVAAGIAVFTFRDQIGAAFAGLFDKIANPTTGFIAIIGMSWNSAMDSLKNYGSNILSNVTENWNAFFDTIIGPENGLIARLGQTWNQAMDGMRDYALTLVRPVTDAWESIIGTVRGVINEALSLAGRAVNSFIDQINRLIAAANSVSAAVRGPQLGLIQPVQVPQFAVGGRVDRPTLIMAGEEGPEYIVPQRKVPQFIQAQMGDEGLGIRQGSSARGSATGGTFAPVIKLQTGPVQQQPDGSQWIRLEDAQAVAADAVGQLWDHLQSYDGRQALGVA